MSRRLAVIVLVTATFFLVADTRRIPATGRNPGRDRFVVGP
jgi:hypothetical protein